MKNFILLTTIAISLLSCTSSPAPVDITKDFITSVYNGKMEFATHYVTPETKDILKLNATPLPPATPVEEGFEFETLKEEISGETAVVRNSQATVPLKKIDGEWRVIASPQLVSSIIKRETDLNMLKASWDKLVMEYEGRVKIARNYINHQKGQGQLSAAAQQLGVALENSQPGVNWTNEKQLAYLKQQDQLQKLIDQALEPSHTAHADLSINYLIQMSNASDRIKTAFQNYQATSQKVSSTVYKPLPVQQ